MLRMRVIHAMCFCIPAILAVVASVGVRKLELAVRLVIFVSQCKMRRVIRTSFMSVTVVAILRSWVRTVSASAIIDHAPLVFIGCAFFIASVVTSTALSSRFSFAYVGRQCAEAF